MLAAAAAADRELMKEDVTMTSFLRTRSLKMALLLMLYFSGSTVTLLTLMARQ